MSRDPFKIRGPAVLSFSGGRTSGRLLWRCLEAGLDQDTHVIFCNTGKEHQKTLDFVQETSVRWNVRIRWLEYRRHNLPRYKTAERRAAQLAVIAASGRTYNPSKKEPCFVEVDYATASRNGEPFENMIDLNGLPNYGAPFCSSELKTRVIKRFMLSLGYKEWDSIVGIRADESHRVAKMRAAAVNERWEVDAPLVAAGETERDVFDFWLGLSWKPGDPFPDVLPQGFDLGLQPEFGNCDMCYKKQPEKLVKISREAPGYAAWWIEQERRTNSLFRIRLGPYARIKELPAVPAMDDAIVCGCTD